MASATVNVYPPTSATTSGNSDFAVGVSTGGTGTTRDLDLWAGTSPRHVTFRLYDGGSSPLGTADLAIGVAGDDWSNMVVATPIACATIKDSASGAVRIGLNATGIGFFNTTPAARPTSAANLTNNVTSGGTDNQIDNYTDLTTYANDAAAIRNNIYQLARKLKQVNDGLRTLGLLS